MNQFIYWEDDADETYLYGSRLAFEGRQVSFANRLMPAGTSLKRWKSKTNFQADRSQPSLPLLHQGKTYQLTLLAQAQPADTLFLKVSFFDILGQLISVTLLRDDDRQFTFPEEAFSYQIELVNGGCHSFEFDALVLSDQEQVRLDIQPEIYYRQGGDRLHVIFLEDPFQPSQQSHPILPEIGDVFLVADTKALAHHYMETDFSRELEAKLAEASQAYDQLVFIGYGPIGNLAALYYHERWAKSQAFVTDERLSLHDYDLALESIGSLSQDSIKSLLEQARIDQTVTIYDQRPAQQTQALSLVMPLISRLDRLAALPFLEERQSL